MEDNQQKKINLLKLASFIYELEIAHLFSFLFCCCLFFLGGVISLIIFLRKERITFNNDFLARKAILLF